MAWNFKIPPEEMTYDQLMDELRAISEQSTQYDFDEVAIRRILDAMEKHDPTAKITDEEVERGLAAIRARHPKFFGELSPVELEKERLLDELADFMDSDNPEDNLDSEKLNALLDRLDEIDPIPNIMSTEESLAAFKKKYWPVLEVLSKKYQE